jgi:hypothetical protein
VLKVRATLDRRAVLAVIVEEQRLRATLPFVVAGPMDNRVDVPPVIPALRVVVQIAVDLAGRCLQDLDCPGAWPSLVAPRSREVVVDRHHLVTCRDQAVTKMASEKAGAAGDEHPNGLKGDCAHFDGAVRSSHLRLWLWPQTGKVKRALLAARSGRSIDRHRRPSINRSQTAAQRPRGRVGSDGTALRKARRSIARLSDHLELVGAGGIEPPTPTMST